MRHFSLIMRVTFRCNVDIYISWDLKGYFVMRRLILDSLDYLYVMDYKNY